MLLKPIALCLVFAGGIASSLSAQRWLSGFRWGDSGQESLEALVALGPDGMLAGGSFTGRVRWNGRELLSRGEEDIFLVRFTPDTGFGEGFSLGGPGSDVLSGLAELPDGGVLAAGEFWQELVFEGGHRLESGANAKALFVSRWSQEATLLWARHIEGGSIKVVRDIVWGGDSSIYVTGYFSDSLRFDSMVWYAEGNSSAFLLKLDSEGRLDWGKTIGGAGDVRAMALVHTNKHLVIAGKYNHRLEVGDTMLQANTRDWDMFLTAFSEEGTLRWVRKAGGVYDDEVQDMTSDAEGNVYLCGKLVGVMQLADGWSIQSRDGNADGFLLKYDKDGFPRQAFTFPGNGVQEALHLKQYQGNLVVTGIFQGTLEWAGTVLQAGSVFHGFMAFLDTSGQAPGLVHLPADKGLLPGALQPLPDGSWLLGGTYQGASSSLPGLSPTAGGFDAFLLHWGADRPTAVAAQAPSWADSLLLVPNPAWQTVRIEGEGWDFASVFTANGQWVRSISSAVPVIALHDLPTGVYFVRFVKDVAIVWRKLWIQR